MTGPRLTTHVLDVTRGRPAEGVTIVVRRDGEDLPLAAATTDADGRTGAPLLEGTDLVPGRYELAYGVGDYFAAKGDVAREDAYLDVVPIRIGLAAATGSVHVALLVTPWSYTTYRGS